MKTIQLTIAFLGLVLVSGLKTAAEYQVSPTKPSYNLRKRKKRTLQEISSNVSNVYVKKRGKRQNSPSREVHQSKNKR